MIILCVPDTISETGFIRVVGRHMNSGVGGHPWYRRGWGLARVHDPTDADDLSGREFSITKDEFVSWGGVL